MINYKDAGNTVAYGTMHTKVISAHFKVRQMLAATGSQLSVALATYRRADADKKDNGIQAVYGPKADVLKSDINDIL